MTSPTMSGPSSISGDDPRVYPSIVLVEAAHVVGPVDWEGGEWLTATSTFLAWPADGPTPLRPDAPRYRREADLALRRLAELVPGWPCHAVSLAWRQVDTIRIDLVGAARGSFELGPAATQRLVWTRERLRAATRAPVEVDSTAGATWQFDAARARLYLADTEMSAQIIGRWSPPFSLWWGWSLPDIDSLGSAAFLRERAEPSRVTAIIERPCVFTGPAGARAIARILAMAIGARALVLKRDEELWLFAVG